MNKHYHLTLNISSELHSILEGMSARIDNIEGGNLTFVPENLFTEKEIEVTKELFLDLLKSIRKMNRNH